jgi:hypothetical protein
MVVGELLALLTTDTPPVAAPVVVGEKVTLSEALCPAARVSGGAMPLAANPDPVTFTCEMLTVPVPVLVREMDRAPLLVPTVTFPKLRDVVLGES